MAPKFYLFCTWRAICASRVLSIYPRDSCTGSGDEKAIVSSLVLLFSFFSQFYVISKVRRNSMQWTDRRVKLLQELLGGMKIIKVWPSARNPFLAWDLKKGPLTHFFTKFRRSPGRCRSSSAYLASARRRWRMWPHSPFLQLDNHIYDSYVRSLLLLRAGTTALAMSLPVLASVLSFVTYSLLGS